jgi:hypothetical protein
LDKARYKQLKPSMHRIENQTTCKEYHQGIYSGK